MYTQGSESNSPLGILRASCHLYRRRFEAFLPVALLTALLMTLPNLLVPAFSHPDIEIVLAAFRQHWALYPLYLIVVLYGFSLLVLRIHPAEDEPSLPQQAWHALRKLPATVVSSLGYTFLFLLGLGLLIIPGIYLAIAFSLYLFTLLIDDAPTFYCLRESRLMVIGHWFRTLVVVLIPWAIVFAGLAVVDVTLYEVGVMGDNLRLLHLAGQVVVLTVLGPYVLTTLYSQFQHLKALKPAEGSRD